MGHRELKEIGIIAYGHRHKIIKGVERLISGPQSEDTHTHVHTLSLCLFNTLIHLLMHLDKLTKLTIFLV